MKLKIVSPDGTTRNTKIVDAETGEELKNVQEFTIHAHAKDGLISATIKLIPIEFDITAEKKKRIRKPKYPDSTAYSKNCIESYKKTIMDGEGRADLDYVADHGIDPNDKLSWYLWRYFIKTFSENKFVKIKTSDIVDFIRKDFGIDLTGIEFKFDKTTTNHCINKFNFIGLLSRQKKTDECIYSFATAVKRRGLDWFRKNNKYLKKHFQSDTNGLFNLMEDRVDQ